MGVSVDTSEVTSGLYQFANFTRARCRKYLSSECNMLENYIKLIHHLNKNITVTFTTLSIALSLL